MAVDLSRILQSYCSTQELRKNQKDMKSELVWLVCKFFLFLGKFEFSG